jgi:hypothetical protein
MRRLTAWIGGIAGGVAAYRFWRRHSQAAAEPLPPEPTPVEPDDRAEELRAKLAESRVDEPVPEEEPAVEPESPDDRRRRVHEEGRAALDEMHSDGADN